MKRWILIGGILAGACSLVALPVSPAETPTIPTGTAEAATPTWTGTPAVTPIWTEIPPPMGEAGAPDPALTGSVVLAEGRCCAGGIVGEVIAVVADFTAGSPYGEIVQMRVWSEFGTNTGDAAVPWEPFQARKEFTFKIPTINWIGFYLSVQFQDSTGHVSPVFSDDISIEGMPATPAP